MALRNVITEEDPQLIKKSRVIAQFNGRIHELLDDMRETLIDARGAGIAAPQVGVLRRAVLIIDNNGEMIELLNPELIEQDGQQDGPEGCLSCPGKWGLVERPYNVKVKAQDRFGNEFTLEAEGDTARACCHEIDHLDGILFTSKAHKFIDESEVADYYDDEDEFEDDEPKPDEAEAEGN